MPDITAGCNCAMSASTSTTGISCVLAVLTGAAKPHCCVCFLA